MSIFLWIGLDWSNPRSVLQEQQGRYPWKILSEANREVAVE